MITYRPAPTYSASMKKVSASGFRMVAASSRVTIFSITCWLCDPIMKISASTWNMQKINGPSSDLAIPSGFPVRKTTKLCASKCKPGEKQFPDANFFDKKWGKKVGLHSNGETALTYFNKMLKEDTLYCLDEPENSLSPKLQLKLAKILETSARYFGCQFIIATHSPFRLALEGARIYDLDATPVDIKNWWELENTKTYYEFFKAHKNLFE